MAKLNIYHVFATAVVLIRSRRRRREKNKKRRGRPFWIRPLFADRATNGAYETLVLKMKRVDRQKFFGFVRMSPNRFEHLLELIKPMIMKKNAVRAAIPPDERLAIALRFLARGESQTSLSYYFKIGKSTVCGIVEEVCEAIWTALQDYVRPPQTPEEWLNISRDFESKWNMPHCIGAIDGKNIAIKAPFKSGTLFHNYKSFFSIVLMAICDANYCFTYVDVGNYGSNNDSGVLLNSQMGKDFKERKMNIPEPSNLDGFEGGKLPYFLVGDEIFPLQEWLIKPYSKSALTSEIKQIFNYRQSRASCD